MITKLIKILSGICAALAGLMFIFFKGKSSGKQEANNANLQQENQILQQQVQSIEQAKTSDDVVNQPNLDNTIKQLCDITKKD